MLNKYGKYIYSLIIFYVIWLVGIPLGFRFIAMPVINMVNSHTDFNISVEHPRIITSIVPNLKFRAADFKVSDKTDSEILSVKAPNINIRLLPLISGRIHINSFQCEDMTVNGLLKDKLYFGGFPISFENSSINARIKRIKIKNFKLLIDEPEKNNKYLLTSKNFYFKNTRTSFIVHGKADFDINNTKSHADFDINLPHSKNLKKTKFNIKLKDFDLSPFSTIINKCIYNEIISLGGKINLSSDDKKMICNLEKTSVIFSDKNKSMIFPDKLDITANYKIGEDSFNIKDFQIKSEKLNSNGKGKIKNIFEKYPKIDMVVNLNKSDIRQGALILPPIITEDINIPKLKEYPFYGNIWGNLKIKGKFPEPDIIGNVKVSDGVLMYPIPNAESGANINIDFTGKQCLLDVIVPAGGREVVYVSGDIMLYGDRFAHLKVKSSQSVDLSLAERVVNPLHEIFCFMIGPVPIMDIKGRGNIDIKIVGTKKDPHIWGDFNFKNTSARFLEVNNLLLEHADGNLNFNNQNAHFINNTGTLHGQKATVEGTCTLFGDLDFNVVANGQNLNDLVKILTTSPMLEDIKSMVPDITDIKGKTDFYLHLGGKLFDINDLKLNENVIPAGYIKLLGNSLKFSGLPANNISGQINYDKKDCDFDLSAMISSASKSTIKGKIKNNIANLSIKSPVIKVNELEPKYFKYIDPLFIKMDAHYKGDINTVEIGGADAVIEVIKNNLPVKNSKIISGKITLKNSDLSIENLNGIIKNNPFYLNLRARNIGDKKLDLTRSSFSGKFSCKSLDMTVLNLIKKANILPYELQKEFNKIEFKTGTADINASARNNTFNGITAGVNMNNIAFDYLIEGKEMISAPIKIVSGNIGIKNNVMSLNKINCLVDNMPVFVYGHVNNYNKNPEYNINLNSKLVQRVFDKYWNSNNIYPIKVNGDILCSANLTGNKNHSRIKSTVKIEENSSIYYMGATVGDKLNPVSANLDADMETNGKIKINYFKYNKIISSQNNKNNVLPLLSITGQIKKLGKIYELKNLSVKTDNPANANLFNIIFKKPTIKSGNFTSNLRINGRSDKPKITGKLTANNIQMPYLNTSVKDLLIDFKPDIINLTTNGNVLDNYIMIHANIKNHLVAPYKINGADIYINNFDIDNSLEQLKQIELRGFSSAIASDSEAGSDIINSILFNNVKIRAGNIQVKNIRASNLEAVCSLNDRMHMSVDSFKFNMASGLISGKLGYNLLNNFMQMELSSKDVNANELVIALFDLPNQIYGSLTGHIELSCNATNDKTRLNTLSGFGSFSVVNGKMPKLGSLEYLLRAGNLIKGGITGLSMNGIIDVVTPMKTGEFSSINGRIRLKDGIAKTIEIRTLGKNLNLYLIGSLNLSTQIADMHVFGQLSRKISTILGAAGNISLNTLFNKIPGISLDKNNQLINDLNKIPGIELSNKSTRKFMVEILGDINGDNFVKSFKWIN